MTAEPVLHVAMDTETAESGANTTVSRMEDASEAV